MLTLTALDTAVIFSRKDFDALVEIITDDDTNAVRIGFDKSDLTENLNTGFMVFKSRPLKLKVKAGREIYARCAAGTPTVDIRPMDMAGFVTTI